MNSLTSTISAYASSMRLAGVLTVLIVMIMTLTNALANQSLAPHIKKEIPFARLSGEGAFRWFGLKIYDAQFWVTRQGYDLQQPLTQKFALDLRYARTLEGKTIAQASDEQIEKLDMGSATQRSLWLKEMIALFPNVKEGEHLTAIYLPQHGTDFYLDGRTIGTIKDDDFARAFFAIWLATETSAPQLRHALLKNAVLQ